MNASSNFVPDSPTSFIVMVAFEFIDLINWIFRSLLSFICLFFICKFCYRLFGCSGVQSGDKRTLNLFFFIGTIFKILFDMISGFVVKWTANRIVLFIHSFSLSFFLNDFMSEWNQEFKIWMEQQQKITLNPIT